MSPTELSDNLSNTSVSVLVSPTIPLDSSHSSISYLSSIALSIIFNPATIGVDKIIPTIPQKYPNINNVIIIVTGCKWTVLLIIIGCKTILSICWIRSATTMVRTPTKGLTVKPTIAASAPPIHGPI